MVGLNAIVMFKNTTVLTTSNFSTWTGLPSLPASINGGSVAILGGKFYAFCGDYLYTYTYSTRSWDAGTQLPYNSKFGSAIIYNHKIHFLGGYNNGESGGACINHYSWDGYRWAKEEDLPIDFTNGLAVADNNFGINILGGNLSLYNHYTYNTKNHRSILSYKDNIIIYDNGERLQICDSAKIKELPKALMSSIEPYPNFYCCAGPESDPLNGLFAY